MRIAIVGSGIAGLASAYLLTREHDVQLFERDDRLGGHAHTHSVKRDGQQWSIDSGFIVFNYQTYPNFVKLLGQLGVSSRPSDMAHSVQCRRCNLEYSSYGLGGYFAQRRRLIDFSHARVLADLPSFFRDANRLIAAPPGADCSLGEFLDRGGYSRGFVRHYLLPMGGTVWSAPRKDMRGFSAQQFLGFLKNHGKLALSGAPPWYTIEGGSRRYVDAIAGALEGRIHTNSAIDRVCRGERSVELQVGAERLTFDRVVMATHADTTLKLLGDATAAEQDALGSFRYASNHAVLHTDQSVLPRLSAARAAWNTVIENCEDESPEVQVTYDLKKLQALPAYAPRFCVSLNQPGIQKSQIIAEMDYEHPVLDRLAVLAQPRVRALSGQHLTSFCGAYLGHGFHEDGMVSAVAVAREFGISL